jgi:Domain of unknown function (DUF4863)
MTPEAFRTLVTTVTDRISGRTLDVALEADLNREFPASGPVYSSIFAACRAAIAAGWMCNREAGGIRYGRVIKPDAAMGGFSVDVVEMKDLAGPHHRHPRGEIDLIMPLTPGAAFDGRPAGWLVYGPDTSHQPTVANGSALVLYLLPDGAIEFTKNLA